MSNARVECCAAAIYGSTATDIGEPLGKPKLPRDSVCIEQQTTSTTTASIEVNLAGHLDVHFRALRGALDAHFEQQAQQLELASQRQHALLAECVQKLGARDGPKREESLPNVSLHPTEAHTNLEVSSARRWPRRASLSWLEDAPRGMRHLIGSHTTEDLDELKDGGMSLPGRRIPSTSEYGNDLRSLATSARARLETDGTLATLVVSPLFDQAVGTLILTNAIFIGVQADWQAKNNGGNPPPWFLIADTMFASLFLLELVLKILAYRTAFFCNPDYRWNIFDMIVVLSGALELFFEVFDDTSGVAADVTYLRIMRVLKLVRVVRIVRVVLVFRELRIMLISVVSTVRSLIWTLISLFGLTFMAGVYITSSVAHHQTVEGRDEHLAVYFGSLPSTLLALFQATSGGIDWRELTTELEKVSWIVVTIFLLYVCLVLYAVMNILTGVCVNQATRAADDDIEFVIQDELSRRNGATNTLQRFFHDADVNNTGNLTWPQLREYLRNDEVRAYFKALGIEVWDLKTFFELLQVPGQEQAIIGIDQFVRGCLRLKGHAKSSDLMALRLEIDQLAKTSCEIQAGIYREIRHTLTRNAFKANKHEEQDLDDDVCKPEMFTEPPAVSPRPREIQTL